MVDFAIGPLGAHVRPLATAAMERRSGAVSASVHPHSEEELLALLPLWNPRTVMPGTAVTAHVVISKETKTQKQGGGVIFSRAYFRLRLRSGHVQ